MMLLPDTQAVPRAKAWAALLLVWIGLALGAGALAERGETRLLLPLLAALVGGLGLWRPWPATGPVAGVVAAGAFALLRLLVDGWTGLATPGAIALVAFAGTGLLADALARQVEADALHRRQDALLIEELTPTHGESGALKWDHAFRHLTHEVARAREHHYAVSLVLFGLDELAAPPAAGRNGRQHAPQDSRGSASGRDALHQLARLALGCTRPADSVSLYGDGAVGVILTHTALEGALAWVDRTRQHVEEALGAEVHAGVVECPADAATADDLIREAEAALQFARAAGLGVASRSLLADDLADEPVDEPVDEREVTLAGAITLS